MEILTEEEFQEMCPEFDEEAFGLQAGWTGRGFGIAEFNDRYGHKCSLQLSSLASEEAVWFGLSESMASATSPNKPWKVVNVREALAAKGAPHEGMEIVTHSRMHLTRGQVIHLLPFLEHFAKTGDLGFRDAQPAVGTLPSIEEF